MLAKMHVLPSDDWYGDGFAFQFKPEHLPEEKASSLKNYIHIFTHIELSVYVYEYKLTNQEARYYNEAIWVKENNLKNYALPTVMKKALNTESI